MTISWLALAAGLLLAPARAQERDGAALRRTLAEILSSSEYETAVPTQGLKESFWRALGRILKQLFSSVTNLGEAAPALLWVLLIVGALILLAILIHGALVVVRAIRASRPGAPEGLENRGAELEDARLLLERAKRSAETGGFGDAVRLCHRAALLGLDRRGLVRFQESLTSGDYKQQLRNFALERKIFIALAELHEPVCFGRAAATELEYSSSRDLAQRLLSGAAS